MRSKISAAALATVLVLGGVACSDDDGGTRGSIEDILDLGEEGDGWGYALTTAGSTGPQPGVQPGQTGYLLAELEAGSYATVCFITGERMVAEFEVT